MSVRKAFLWVMVVSFVLSALLGIAALVIPVSGPHEELLASVALFGVFSLVALICAVVLEKRHMVPLMWFGIGASALALVGWLFLIWFEQTLRNPAEERVIRFSGTMSILAAQAAHMGALALPSFDRRWPGRVRWTTAFAGATLALIWVALIWWWDAIESVIDDDNIVRIGGTLAILTACGTVVTPILWKMQQVQRRETRGSIEERVRVTVICPRCTERNELRAGPGRCAGCGLRMSIEVEEPRCACGYLLHRLESDRCPECGCVVPEEDRWG